MQNPEGSTVVDITHILERRDEGGTSAPQSRYPRKTDGIRAKVRSLAGKLLERKEDELQRRMKDTLRTRVIGRTGPVSVEQNIPEQFIEILMDVLYKMQEEEKKPYPQHANIITTAIERLSAVAMQSSIKQELIQKTVAEACGEFDLANPSYVAKLLTQSIENELES